MNNDELKEVLRQVITKASDGDEAVQLGLALEQVKALDADISEVLEIAIGDMSRVLMQEAYLAGARHGRALQPKPSKGNGFRGFFNGQKHAH